MRNSSRGFVSVTIASVVLISCATPPVEVSEDERRTKAQELQALFDEQEPITQPLTVADAMARAIKYNVDHRVRLMEQVFARTDLDVSRMDLLPRLVADAGYSKRSNENASASQSVNTGLPSLEPSRSSEREQDLVNASLVWNLLDFGVSYVSAQQRADQVLIAEERRRKAIQNIIQDVRRAYWQALYAQRLGGDLDQLIIDIEASVERSRELREQGLQPPSIAARFQDALLTTMRQMWRIRRDLETAHTQLAQLINVAPGTEFELDPTPDEMGLPMVDETPVELEQRALTDRPELREEDYRLRIDQAEVKKAMLRMLPGLEIDLGVHYDSNDFLVNNDWSDAGLQISWNLFNLFSGPAYSDQAKARVDLDSVRRLAISMAVLTQVHVAFENYRDAKINYELANELMAVSTQIQNQYEAQRQAEVASELAGIRSRARALVAQLQRDQAFTQVQNAVGRIHNSIGMDPMPETTTSYDLPTLATAIAEHQNQLNRALEQTSPAEVEDPPIVESQPLPEGKDAMVEYQPVTATREWTIEFHPMTTEAHQSANQQQGRRYR
jgi:outer membrane protein TolC